MAPLPQTQGTAQGQPTEIRSNHQTRLSGELETDSMPASEPPQVIRTAARVNSELPHVSMGTEAETWVCRERGMNLTRKKRPGLPMTFCYFLRVPA